MAEFDLEAWAQRASKALCKVRPLGGSELFIRRGDGFIADPEYCGAAIEKIHQDLHNARRETVLLRRRAEAAEATLKGLKWSVCEGEVLRDPSLPASARRILTELADLQTQG